MDKEAMLQCAEFQGIAIGSTLATVIPVVLVCYGLFEVLRFVWNRRWRKK